MRSHEWIDQRSLALHDAVAKKLAEHPELLEVARRNLRRWLAQNRQPALLEWQHLLDTLPFNDLLALLRSTDERARRLRQSSPFAGVLTPQERLAILERYESQPV
ncbi:MAG: hypothetical protein HY735_03620 [Verrucomicrobia bacterium]|nr:hypothetical protein [Verrucomicrobiota bacterium]